ncbi:hypothetical protein ACFC1R_20775 [Kitasatospora sp. NPDC056138]|uniref:hypothetical protein n=1 Tax=Kitasatospora sp. NPDC056138 TaxID=3345724 RepID=UPI0035D6073D
METILAVRLEKRIAMIHSENGEIRPRGIVVRSGSPFARAIASRRPAALAGKAPEAEPAAAAAVTTDGFREIPKWDLKDHKGRKIADLVFVNRFVGGAAAWAKADMDHIDQALAAAMTDSTLQSVVAQYYPGKITSTALPPAVVDLHTPQGSRFFKDQAEDLARELFLSGVLGDHDPGQCVIDMMLPRGVILVDGFSPGFQPPPGEEEEHARRERALIKIDDDEGDSTQGLGGYHGSVQVNRNGRPVTTYYAVGVFSEGDNGIAVFDGADNSWANVVATFYHELNEARTDPDVEDAVRFNDASKIGWYSETGRGEIGDLPINEAESGFADITNVFRFVKLADGSGEVPVQLMWSNAVHAPAAR